jgi:hypothetical protein
MRAARYLIPGVFAIFLAFPGHAAAQEPARGRQAVAVPAPPPVAGYEAPDADRTREQFRQLMEKYPPSLARVLKLDSSLLNNDAYLAPYPALTGFLAQHPEVRRNPTFFLEWVNVSSGGYYHEDAQSQAYRMWNDVLAGTAGISVFIIVLLALGWAIRYIVDYRRWHRLSKVQTDVHNKLLDRMTANDELLAYVKSPAGSRFLESAPIALDPVGRKIGAPFSRILWSVQAAWSWRRGDSDSNTCRAGWMLRSRSPSLRWVCWPSRSVSDSCSRRSSRMCSRSGSACSRRRRRRHRVT